MRVYFDPDLPDSENVLTIGHTMEEIAAWMNDRTPPQSADWLPAKIVAGEVVEIASLPVQHRA